MKEFFMKRFAIVKIVTVVVLGAALFFNAVAADASVQNQRPVMLAPGNVLGGILDGITAPGTQQINTTADQSSNAVFTDSATGGSIASMVLQITANSAIAQEFGLYQYVDGVPDRTVKVFDKTDGTGSKATIAFNPDGSIDVYDKNGSIDSEGPGFGDIFGFYWKVGTTTWYSEDSLNGGAAHMLAFQGNDNTRFNVPGLTTGKLFQSSTYLLAWEADQVSPGDQTYGNYDDLVLMVESIEAVPEPATIIIWSLMIAVGCVAMKARRRRGAV
jgi:hypothetical protein